LWAVAWVSSLVDVKAEKLVASKVVSSVLRWVASTAASTVASRAA
jgi:hypothetical protein